MNIYQENFMTTVTHELRTPLTSIRALSSILHDNPDLDLAQREQFLDIILQESERLTGVVDEVLELTELELGLAEWHLTEVNVKMAVEAALTIVTDLYQQKQVQLQLQMPAHAPKVLADPQRLTEALVSLLTNAVTFCDDTSGWVGLRMHTTTDMVQIDVCDNGPSLNTPDRPGLIDQMPDQTALNSKQTSLGLLISRDIITHFNGQLWADETLGHGVTISFSLPLAGD